MQTGVVVLVSGAAGVMSAVLGFIAEAKRLTARVAALIAAVFYWVGVTLNAPTTGEAKFVGPIEECYVLKGGIFVRAAVLNLVATSLGIMSCVLLRLPAATTDVTVEGQHAVGLPEWQAPNPGFAPSLLLLLLLRVRRTLQYCPRYHCPDWAAQEEESRVGSADRQG